VRLLFVKHGLAWPRSSGHDVHTYYMMRACAELGHEVALATVETPSARALEGLPLFAHVALDAGGAAPAPCPGTRLQRRFRSYWGLPEARIAALGAAAANLRVDAVVVAGLDALPYFPALAGVTRVWYAADEWMLHHLSQVRPGSHTIGEDLRAAFVKGLYERAHRRVVDRVWVVSERDRRAMRLVAGIDHVDVMPNGVDGEFFAPGGEPPADRTAVFWGRLDFGPNVQALEWFCHRVWPLVRRSVPDARFTIIGFHPGEAVHGLASIPGVSLEADLPDLRAAARRRALAVLPFVSGAGIKNKLLEAAALGLPIVCTPRAALGLRGRPPIASASSPARFAGAMASLWANADERRRLATAARTWVLEQHTWTAVARDAIAGLEATAGRTA
jgi:glycosyltransferase involved in cell wall biosynthesis